VFPVPVDIIKAYFAKTGEHKSETKD